MTNPQEHKIPIARSEGKLIEQEFDSIREKFELEMAKMEQEMSKFRQQLLARGQRSHFTSTSRSSSQMTTKSSVITDDYQCSESGHDSTSFVNRTSQGSESRKEQSRHHQTGQTSNRANGKSLMNNFSTTIHSSSEQQRQNHAEFLNQVNSPLIKDSSDGREKFLKLRFDVTQYEPEHISVKTIDNRLIVQARREEKSASMMMQREYNREFLLPEGINPELVRSSLSADMILTVEAPLAEFL